MDIQLLRESLDELTTSNGYRFAAKLSDGDDAIEVIVEDREEFPILVWVDGEQILCVTYLWNEAQIDPEQRSTMYGLMLEVNISLPLSSFGKIGGRYVLFGALSAKSSINSIITEVEVLSDNTLEAIEIVAPYLQAA